VGPPTHRGNAISVETLEKGLAAALASRKDKKH
jgi:hypothetical protein